MKIKLVLPAAALAWCAALSAAPLSVTTAVQSQPDPASPVIVVLSAGAEQPAPTDKAGPAPAGWIEVEVPGPFTGFVKNRDLTKQLDIRPGASVFLEPKDGASVLTVFASGEKAEITGLHGGWTQVRLDSPLVGYIATAPEVTAPAPAAPAPAAANPASPAPAPSPSSAAPAQGEAPALSQLFEGTLASSESLLYPHRPYKWQLNDASGHRIAYIDLARILMTDQIDNYAGHTVVVLGSLRPVKESRDIVIDVEAFHLK